jgi:hypothetical protein
MTEITRAGSSAASSPATPPICARCDAGLCSGCRGMVISLAFLGPCACEHGRERSVTAVLVLAKIASAPKPTAAEAMRARAAIAASTRAGGDRRGNTRDRARRTARLLVEFGDGRTCRCVYCPRELTAQTLTQDRIWPGERGGSYRYANLLPACLGCNQRRGATDLDTFIAGIERELAEIDAGRAA